MNLRSVITTSFVALIAGPSPADEIQLTDGAHLTGEVMSIDPSGKLSANLPIAVDPIEIRTDHIRQVRFDGSGRHSSEHDARLTLRNGDTLPCDIVSIDEKELTVATSFSPTLSIPREAIAMAQVGIRPDKLIYKGPEDSGPWNLGDKWRIGKGALISDGRGAAFAEFDELSASYRLRFTLAWNRSPNIQIYFNSPIAKEGVGGFSDRYYIQFGSAGIELKRQSSGPTTHQTLVPLSDRTPETFPDKKVEIEVRVDHRQRALYLFLDGISVGKYLDPVQDAPTGKGIIFHSTDSEKEGHRIMDIALLEWDPAGERHKSEERGKGKGDALIDNEGQRFTGSLTGTQGGASNLVALFKSPHFPDAMEIPMSRVSTIFFEGEDAPNPDPSPLHLALVGGGSLGARDCSFTTEDVKLTHSLLGDLVIKRSAVEMLTRNEDSDEEDNPNDEE